MVRKIRVRQEVYDPKVGEWVRAERSSDPFHIATTGAVNTASSSTVLASGTLQSDEIGFITDFSFGAADADEGFAVVVDGSTLLPVLVDADIQRQETGRAPINAPFARVDAGATVELMAFGFSTSTVTASVTIQRFPAIDSLETE